LITRQKFDAIVHGVVFHDMAGLELAVRLQRDRATRSTPRIALTGFTDASALDAIAALACYAVLIKPCSPEGLIRELRRAIACSRAARRHTPVWRTFPNASAIHQRSGNRRYQRCKRE